MKNQKDLPKYITADTDISNLNLSRLIFLIIYILGAFSQKATSQRTMM